MKYKMVEKSNHLHVHAYFDSMASGKRFLKEVVPVYCQRGYYMDKTLTPDSFEIIEC